MGIYCIMVKKWIIAMKILKMQANFKMIQEISFNTKTLQLIL